MYMYMCIYSSFPFISLSIQFATSMYPSSHSQGKPLIYRLHLSSCFGGKGVVIYYMYGLLNINVHLRQLYPHPKSLPEAFCTLFVSAQT